MCLKFLVMNNQIKTIIFDLGGVLYDLDRERCVAALENLGLKDVDSLLSNYKQSGVFQQLEEGSISAETFYSEIRSLIGTKVPDEAIKAAWDSFLVAIPDYKLEMVAALKERFQIFMLSNTNEIHFNSEIPNAFLKNGKTIDDYFDTLYLSYKMKASKPHKKIFELMVEDSGIVPSECFFIDDSPENIRVAAEMGFNTYLAKPYEDFTHLFETM